MKWLIAVLIMIQHPDGSKDAYLYYQPTFNSSIECRQYVEDNAATIKRDMFIQFSGAPIESVWCIQEDKIDKFLGTEDKPKIEA
jgi:hypothetical protein